MFVTSHMSLSFLSTNRPSQSGDRLSRQGPETRQHVVLRRIEGRRHSVHASSAVSRGRAGCDAIYHTHRYLRAFIGILTYSKVLMDTQLKFLTYTFCYSFGEHSCALKFAQKVLKCNDINSWVLILIVFI